MSLCICFGLPSEVYLGLASQRRPPFVVQLLHRLLRQLLEDGLAILPLPHRLVEFTYDCLVIFLRQVRQERRGRPVAAVVMGPIRVDPPELARWFVLEEAHIIR